MSEDVSEHCLYHLVSRLLRNVYKRYSLYSLPDVLETIVHNLVCQRIYIYIYIYHIYLIRQYNTRCRNVTILAVCNNMAWEVSRQQLCSSGSFPLIHAVVIWPGFVIETQLCPYNGNSPDSKVHRAYMGPTWGRQDPGGPQVGPMNFAIRETLLMTHVSGLVPYEYGYNLPVSRHNKPEQSSTNEDNRHVLQMSQYTIQIYNNAQFLTEMDTQKIVPQILSCLRLASVLVISFDFATGNKIIASCITKNNNLSVDLYPEMQMMSL